MSLGFKVDRYSVSYCLLVLLAGIAVSLLTPVLSLFLSDELGVSSFKVGVYFTCNACAGILVSQILAVISDRTGNRRIIVLISALMGFFAMILYSVSTSYEIIATLGVFMLSFITSITPQLFAAGREFCARTGREPVMFLQIMRIQFSLAWVMGPPLAFAFMGYFGFRKLFLLSSAVYFITFAAAFFLLPKGDSRDRSSIKGEKVRVFEKNVMLLFIACTLMWTSNTMYLIAMPQYVTHILRYSSELSGFMMGTAAFLEMPLMLVTGKFARRLGIRTFMILAASGGVLFYVTMLFVTSPFLLLAAQFFNAVYIGILAGIGMVYFQELLPSVPGEATTLFSNSAAVGGMAAGVTAGSIAALYGFDYVFTADLLLAAAAFVMLFFVRKV